MSPAEGYRGSHQAYDVVCDRVMIPMRDGINLATDIYLPALNGQPAPGSFPALLERTPYDRTNLGMVTNGAYFARRGYICAVQDVRGRFDSEGEWYPFAREAPDGYDTVEWLAAQPWSDGQVGTIGASYAGSDQSALATLNPPHLKSMVVSVGAANYYHASMRQNGALELRFMIYAFRMATTSREALADPVIRAAAKRAFERVGEWLTRTPMKAGASTLRLLPSYEQWVLDILSHGEYDDYWQQRGYAISDYYDEHADVPTLYLGGWYDSYARATCENFTAFSQRKSSAQRLLMGPWTHGGWNETHSGEVEFGKFAAIHYNDMRLAWFDHYLKGFDTEVAHWPAVQLFTMGGGSGRMSYYGRLQHGGYWRDEAEFPLPDTRYTPFYLRAGGWLSQTAPTEEASDTAYTFDPRDPVPTIGGGISAALPIMDAGGFDQRGRPDFYGCQDSLPLNARSDVLTFQTEGLPQDVEVTGPISVHLYAASSALDTDFTAKLMDVYPPNADYPDGFALNLTDSILRARYRESWTEPTLLEPGQVYEFVFQLYPTSNVFKAGHRIRVDISSSNFPRFDVNPNTGGPLGVDRRFASAHQTIYHDARYPSHIVLPLIERS